ncbi:unnamed protein product [Arabidopsis arenosa]|uniref:Zinc knuckle CX2CX4HX4C domain-containing protein n=1 Tax=Arabidopsis arenosa TaxID=38785 RepID=A0A8S1ZM38_ARAAE|nr:unnamed protein product [Arabidopsis arenosa]
MKNSIRDGQATRDSPSSEDDEPIQLPALDNSALIRRFRFTVVGRVFHTGGRSMEAFLAFMPSAGIWDVEGRAREAFRGIGDAIGRVSEVDVTEARVLVAVNVTKPLKFKKRVLTDNGEEVMVSLTYEKLFRYCFTCHLISHEERDCPHLSENQKQLNKDRRGGIFANGGRRPEEERALAVRREREHRDGNRSREERRGEARVSGRRSTSELSSRATNLPSQSSNPPASRQVRRNLYLTKEVPRSDTNRNPVWQRIGVEADKTHHRNREPSIQSSSGSRKKPEDVPQRTLEIRRSSDGHRIPLRRRESPLRIRSPAREEPSLENWRSSRRPPRHQSNRSERTPSAHRDFPAGCGSNLAAKEKGKGKMVDVAAHCVLGDDEAIDAATPVPADFEFGSGSGTAAGANEVLDSSLPHPQEITTGQGKEFPASAGEVGRETMMEDAAEEVNEGEDWVDEDDGLADWAEDDTGLSDWTEDDTLARVPDEQLEIQCTQGGDSIPSDWENLVDEEADTEKEITEEDIRLMQELEKEMILDGLLDNDDLLGEELLAGDNDGMMDEEDSQERTLSEAVVPIVHSRVEVPATSQSPSSKRHRSPSRERSVTRRSSRSDGPAVGGPGSVVTGPVDQNGISEPKNSEPKKTVIPQSPKLFTAASRKLKLFGPKISPKKRSAPPVSGPLGEAPSRSVNNNPQQEAVSTMNNKDKKKEAKAKKPMIGEAESRISPDPPT